MKGSFQKFFFGIISVVSVLGQDGVSALYKDDTDLVIIIYRVTV